VLFGLRFLTGVGCPAEFWVQKQLLVEQADLFENYFFVAAARALIAP